MNATVLIVFYAADQQPKSPLRVMFIALNTVLVSILACRVFRVQKLGKIKGTIGIGSSGSTEVPLHVSSFAKRHTLGVPVPVADSSFARTPQTQIEVSKVIEWTDDFNLDKENNHSPSMPPYNKQYGDV